MDTDNIRQPLKHFFMRNSLPTQINISITGYQQRENSELIFLNFSMSAASKGLNGKALQTVPRKFLLALISLSNPVYTLDTMFSHQLMHIHDLYHFMTHDILLCIKSWLVVW